MWGLGLCGWQQYCDVLCCCAADLVVVPLPTWRRSLLGQTLPRAAVLLLHRNTHSAQLTSPSPCRSFSKRVYQILAENLQTSATVEPEVEVEEPAAEKAKDSKAQASVSDKEEL
jgi:hypothetical protein